MTSTRARWLIIILVQGLAARVLSGQTAEEYERVLVPVYSAIPAPGAFGSLWSTELWLRNNGQTPVDVRHYDYGCILATCAPTPPTPPNVTFRPRIGESPPGLRGKLMFVERRRATDVAFGLRVRDLSRQAQTAGTEIPVVREEKFTSGIIALPDVPVSGNFRHVVRIYGLDPTRAGSVLLRVYGINPAARIPQDPAIVPDRLLGQTVVHLQVAGPAYFPNHPSFAEIGNLNSIASPAGDERVLVLVEPLTEGLRIWAFASVVHNETQHLTVISPQ